MSKHAERDQRIRDAFRARRALGETRYRAAWQVGLRIGLTRERVLQIVEGHPRVRRQAAQQGAIA